MRQRRLRPYTTLYYTILHSTIRASSGRRSSAGTARRRSSSSPPSSTRRSRTTYIHICICIYIYIHIYPSIIYIYIYICICVCIYIYIYISRPASRDGTTRDDATPQGFCVRVRVATRHRNLDLQRADLHNQSYTSKGTGRQGKRFFCKEFPCFNTMPCRHVPLLVHF